MNIFFFLIPILAVVSNYLIKVSLVLRNKVYGRHVIVEHFILNPGLDEHHFLPKFSFSLWITTFIFSAISIMTGILSSADNIFALFVLGFFLGLLGASCGLSLFNIAVFYYANRHPESLQGTVHFSQPFLLAYTQAVLLVPLFLVLLGTIVEFTPCHLGILFGIICMICLMERWKRKYKTSQS